MISHFVTLKVFCIAISVVFIFAYSSFNLPRLSSLHSHTNTLISQYHLKKAKLDKFSVSLIHRRRISRVRSVPLQSLSNFDCDTIDSPLSKPSDNNSISYLHMNSSDSEVKSPLIQLSFEYNCSVIDGDELSELVLELGCLSVSIEGIEEQTDYLNNEKLWGELQKMSSWSKAILKAQYPSTRQIQGIIDIIHDIYPNQTYNERISHVEEKDWVLCIQQDWKPQLIKDITIRFPWHRNVSITTPYELTLEGGAAFGTGEHPTTRLCVSWLSDVIKSEKSMNINVLDYGCGSGVLGLAALRFGASEATGVDIDEDSLKSARNNCKMNNLSMNLVINSQAHDSSSSPSSFDSETTIKDKKYNIIMANILAPILIDIVDTLGNFSAPGGLICLSGLVTRQANTVIEHYSKHFTDLSINTTEDDWVIITGKKKL